MTCLLAEAPLWSAAMGWLGVVVLLVSFVLTLKSSFGLPPLYYWLNLVGSIGIGTNSYMNGAMPSAILNLVWAVAALAGLVIAEIRMRKNKAAG